MRKQLPRRASGRRHGFGRLWSQYGTARRLGRPGRRRDRRPGRRGGRRGRRCGGGRRQPVISSKNQALCRPVDENVHRIDLSRTLFCDRRYIDGLAFAKDVTRPAT